MRTSTPKNGNTPIISDYPNLPRRSRWREMALDAKILAFVLLLAGICWTVAYFFDTS